MNTFDCRSLKDSKCRYLVPSARVKFGKIPHMYFCNKMHITLFPEIYNKSKINETTVSIKPDFNCPYVQKLRKKGQAPLVEFSINPDRSSTYWN